MSNSALQNRSRGPQVVKARTGNSPPVNLKVKIGVKHFKKGDQVFSRIIQGRNENCWVPCTVVKAHPNGTYMLQIHEHKKYKCYPYADRVKHELLLSRLPSPSLISPRYNAKNEPQSTKSQKGFAWGKQDSAKKTEEKTDHPLIKDAKNRQRGGQWDKVQKYWKQSPNKMQAVRPAILQKLVGGFKKLETNSRGECELDKHPWKLSKSAGRITESGKTEYYTCNVKGWSIKAYKLVIKCQRQTTNPPGAFDLFKCLQADNQYCDRNREFMELVDWWENPGNGLSSIAVKAETIVVPMVSNRFSCWARGNKPTKSGMNAVSFSIKHPLVKKAKGTTRYKYEIYERYERGPNGELTGVLYNFIDMGGMIPGMIVNKVVPTIMGKVGKVYDVIATVPGNSTWDQIYAKMD